MQDVAVAVPEHDPSLDTGGIAGHPKGLMTLFYTEMWERFSYYGMRALLILYLTSALTDGGAGWDAKRAAALYGWYTMLVYATSLPGGWIADRFLGQQRAVLVGGIVIALGHFSMAFPGMGTFYLGLLLIILGTGLLKPNVSTIVGQLYREGDPRRDAGFSIYYMGINLGAFLAPLVCGYLAQGIHDDFGVGNPKNWHWGFAAAGVGMTAGVIQYSLGRRRLGGAGLHPSGPAKKAAPGTDASGSEFTPTEWKRIGAILVLFVFSMLFWSAFEQAGSSLNLFADRMTDCSIFGWKFPSTWFQSVNSIFIIALAPVFAWIWTKMGKAEPSSPAKFANGLLFVGLGFGVIAWAASLAGTSGKVGPGWLVLVYLLHTVGELCLSPVGLSTVTKLAPPRIVGFMMGVWFLSISFGNKIGGWIAGFFETFPLPQLFGAVFLTTTAAAIVLALLVRPIRGLMSGVH